jgi:periplasmic copper chaperone A
MARSTGAAACFAIAMVVAMPAVSAWAENYTVGSLTLRDPYSRETPPGARTAAGYLTIENSGDTDDRLVSVTCRCSEAAEIHSMKMEGGVMRMRQLPDGIAVPAKGSTALESGGNHLMFINIKQPFKAGAKIAATLTFEHAGSVDAEFTVDPLMGKGRSGHKMHGTSN